MFWKAFQIRREGWRSDWFGQRERKKETERERERERERETMKERMD